jgi:diguanylate cyclase (GGDEF)-like protein/PAS domain S-box-containing protein
MGSVQLLRFLPICVLKVNIQNKNCSVLNSLSIAAGLLCSVGNLQFFGGQERWDYPFDLAGHSMTVASRDHAKELALAPILHGPANRRRTLRVLFVQVAAADVAPCVRELRRAHCKVSADVVSNSEQFVEHLNSKSYDVVLAKYPARIGHGPPILEVLRPRERHIPVIFLADTMKPETAAKLITQGAADCIDTDHLGHLPIAIRRALSENNLREERDQSEKKLRHSEARYRALVGNLTYGMCRCNQKGNFLDVNQALVAMLGYSSRRELLAASYARDILCDPFKRGKLLAQPQNGNGGAPIEIDWRRKDGTLLKVRLSGREVSTEGEKDSYEIIVEDVTQQRKLEDSLRQQASKDPLTGLANYRHLVEVIDTEIKRSERTAREFALLFLDLDGLKKINDAHGHLVGSQALCRLADVLCNSSRDMDTAARFGGDEFALVLPETGEVPANLVAGRICANLAHDGRKPKLSVSIGVAIYPRDGERIDTLMGAADVAVYAMKARAHAPGTHDQRTITKPRYQAAAGGGKRSTSRAANG